MEHLPNVPRWELLKILPVEDLVSLCLVDTTWRAFCVNSATQRLLTNRRRDLKAYYHRLMDTSSPPFDILRLLLDLNIISPRDILEDSILKHYDSLTQWILTRYKIDVNGWIHRETTFLGLALTHDSSSHVIQMLLEAGADPNEESLYVSPIIAAIRRSNLKTLELLLKYGADPTSTSEGGVPALSKAVSYNQYDMVELLLSNPKINVNQVDRNSNTALMYALLYSDAKMVRLLLEHDADPNLANNAGDTPLMRALMRQSAEEAQILIEGGANVNVLSSNGITPLNQALNMANPSIIRLLLEHGANPNPPMNPISQVLSSDYYRNQEEIIRELVAGGSNPNRSDEFGRLPIHEMVYEHNIPMIKLLRELGADPHLPDAFGHTADYYARGDPSLLSLLD